MDPANTAPLSTTESPNTWNIGSAANTTSSGPSRPRPVAVAMALERRFVCVSRAPLGRPVVPEV